MTRQQRYDEWIYDVSHTTLAEATASGEKNYLVWIIDYWDYVENGTPPGGTHPPHKPPI